MLKKVSIFALIFILMPLSLNAEQILYDENSNVVASGSDICANQVYTLLDDVNTSRRSIFVLDEKNYIKDVINTNKKETKVKFPSNINNIKLLLVNKVDDKYDFSNSYYTEYNVKDCSLEKITNNYSEDRLKYDLTYDNGSFTYAGDSKDSYELTYQTDKSKKMKSVPFNEPLQIESDTKVVQLHESYKEKDKDVNKYYEINIIDEETFVIRKVKSLDIKEIKFKNFINYKFLIIAILAFIFFLLFYKLERVNRAKRKNFKNKLVKKYKR